LSFNSFTYYANKYRRKAKEQIAEARSYRAAGRTELVEKCVKLARIYSRLSVSSSRQRQMQKEHGW
jgi:hypothetical protein